MENQNLALQAIRQQIQEKSKQDPHIAAKIASRFLQEQIFSWLTDDKGVHIESAFAFLGSLAGQACLQSALHQKASLMTLTDQNHRNYYYGDAINHYLFENTLSLWSLIGGAVQSHGGHMPDKQALVKHVASSIGHMDFGKPRLPNGVEIRINPMDCLQAWSVIKENIFDTINVPADDWVVAYGLTLQNLIDQGKEVLSPNKAAIIIMECAVPMSKILPPQ